MNFAVVNVDTDRGVVTVQAVGDKEGEYPLPDDFPAAIETLREGLKVPRLVEQAAASAGIPSPRLGMQNRKPYPFYGDEYGSTPPAPGAVPLTYRVDIPVSAKLI